MRTRIVALAAATATALSGCSMLSSGDGSSDSSGSAESSQSDQGSGQSSGGDSEGESGEATAKTALAAGIDPEDPPKPIAKGVFKPADSATVESAKIELVKLQPKDNVMLAVFRLTGEGRGNEVTSVFELLGERSFAPVFIDLENLEKYTTVDDLSSDQVFTEAPLGEPLYYFTAFPLPKDGVESMNLRLAEQMGAIEDVPMPQS